MCENRIEDGKKTLTDSTREQHKRIIQLNTTKPEYA